MVKIHIKKVLFILTIMKIKKLGFTQIHGKELSYNNFNDMFASLDILESIRGKAGTVVIKHANPCGVCARNSPLRSRVPVTNPFFARPQCVRDRQGRRRRIMGCKCADDIRNYRITDCGACGVVDKNMIRRIRCQRIQSIFYRCIARGAPCGQDHIV